MRKGSRPGGAGETGRRAPLRVPGRPGAGSPFLGRWALPGPGLLVGQDARGPRRVGRGQEALGAAPQGSGVPHVLVGPFTRQPVPLPEWAST